MLYDLIQMKSFKIFLNMLFFCILIFLGENCITIFSGLNSYREEVQFRREYAKDSQTVYVSSDGIKSSINQTSDFVFFNSTGRNSAGIEEGA